MQRITITIDDDLLEAVDGLMTRRGYASRSEAFRDIVRDTMDRNSSSDPKAACIATLSYVFDHATRDLASRLTHAHHEHHDLSVASLHVHLDHEACLEVSVLRGPSGAVTAFADTLATQRGCTARTAARDSGSGVKIDPQAWRSIVTAWTRARLRPVFSNRRRAEKRDVSLS